MIWWYKRIAFFRGRGRAGPYMMFGFKFGGLDGYGVLRAYSVEDLSVSLSLPHGVADFTVVPVCWPFFLGDDPSDFLGVS